MIPNVQVVSESPVIGRTSTIDDLLKAKHEQEMSGAEATILTMMGLNPVVFGLPGGAILPLEQYITAYKSCFRYFQVKHEMHAPVAAGAYGEVAGVPAFALVTSGPGVANSMTGLYENEMEFERSVTVSGNGFLDVLKDRRKRGFQVARAVEGGLAFGKNAYLVEDRNTIQRILIDAFRESMTLPFGSILVDIPKDIQTKGTTRFEYFEPPKLDNQYTGNLDYKVLHEFDEALKSHQDHL